jgi:hypothetical protein
VNPLAPRLLRHLVNVTGEPITGASVGLVLRPGADPDDPDAWGVGLVVSAAALLTDDNDPLVFLTDEDETSYLTEG